MTKSHSNETNCRLSEKEKLIVCYISFRKEKKVFAPKR